MDIHNPEKEKFRDADIDQQLRPLSFNDFKGQFKIVENLHIFVQAALMREEIGRAHV